MHKRLLSFVVYLALLLLSIAWAHVPAALAVETPDAAQRAGNRQVHGFYRIIDTIPSGQNVKVLLRLHLYNHGDDDLRICYAALAVPFPAEGRNNSMTGIEISRHSSRTFVEEFTVPRREIARWGVTAQPKIILSLDASGRRHTETISLDSQRMEEN